MKLSLSITLYCITVAAMVAIAAPAAAKVGDAEWAQCVVRSDQAGAQAWLTMATPAWESDFSSANLLLGHRLAALCDATPAQVTKPKRMPSWKMLSSSLRKAVAKGSVALGASPVTVKLCTSSVIEDGKDLLFRHQIVRGEGGSDVVVFEQYYGNVQGRAVKLPTDLHVVPKDPSTVKRACRLIGSNGELSDA